MFGTVKDFPSFRFVFYHDLLKMTFDSTPQMTTILGQFSVLFANEKSQIVYRTRNNHEVALEIYL